MHGRPTIMAMSRRQQTSCRTMNRVRPRCRTRTELKQSEGQRSCSGGGDRDTVDEMCEVENKTNKRRGRKAKEEEASSSLAFLPLLLFVLFSTSHISSTVSLSPPPLQLLCPSLCFNSVLVLHLGLTLFIVRQLVCWRRLIAIIVGLPCIRFRLKSLLPDIGLTT